MPLALTGGEKRVTIILSHGIIGMCQCRKGRRLALNIKNSSVKCIALLLIFALLFAFAGCDSPSVREHTDNTVEVISRLNYEKNGSFCSQMGTPFNIVVNWSVSDVRMVSDGNYVACLRLDIMLECDSIDVPERKNCNTLTVGDQEYSFSTDAVKATGTQTVQYRLFSKVLDFDIEKNGSVELPVSVKWKYGQKLNGKMLEIMRASDTITVSSSEFGDVTDETQTETYISEHAKRVAITFDDGPHFERTKLIVDKAEEYGAHVTFFVVGNRIGWDNGAAMIYAAEHDCEIGIHGYTHEKYYDTCSDSDYYSEIHDTLDTIHAYLPDYNVRLLRPIGGKITESRAAASEFSVILWDVDSSDWENTKQGENGELKDANINTIVENVMSDVEDGDIILMHDIYENTYEAFCIIIDKLYEQGFEVVTVSELIGDSLRAGVVYTHG